jgi:hypothetical protein
MPIADRMDVFNMYSMPTAPDPQLDPHFGDKLLDSLRMLIGLDAIQFQALLGFVRDDVAQSLSMIDWAGEFEKLQK